MFDNCLCRKILFSFGVEKRKKQNTEEYNFACGFVWCVTWFLTLRKEESLMILGEKCAEMNVWTEER
jgi:hypothetical protein